MRNLRQSHIRAKLTLCVQVIDNVGVDASQVTSWPARGYQFNVGTTTRVTYTAVDRAGLRASCGFNVQLNRQCNHRDLYLSSASLCAECALCSVL